MEEKKTKSKKTWDFLNFDIEPHIYKNPKKTIRLEYSRHNEDYKVIKEDLKYRDKEKTFKDFIYHNLNPIVEDKSNATYGVAPTFEPLTTRINKAKETLEHYKQERAKTIEKIKELEAKANIEQTPQEGGPTND